MNTCIFTFSPLNDKISNIHIFFDELYDGIMKIGNDEYSKIVSSNVNFTFTKNVKMCKIYGNWKLAYFTIYDAYITIIRADNCVFSKFNACSSNLKFLKQKINE